MIIEKRTGDEEVTVVVQFEEQMALVGNFEIKVGDMSIVEGGANIKDGSKEFIGLLGNLDGGPPINVIISKEIFGYMKDVFDSEEKEGSK